MCTFFLLFRLVLLLTPPSDFVYRSHVKFRDSISTNPNWCGHDFTRCRPFPLLAYSNLDDGTPTHHHTIRSTHEPLSRRKTMGPRCIKPGSPLTSAANKPRFIHQAHITNGLSIWLRYILPKAAELPGFSQILRSARLPPAPSYHPLTMRYLPSSRLTLPLHRLLCSFHLLYTCTLYCQDDPIAATAWMNCSDGYPL
ncbi:hypothetical protein Hypma_010781 [Hypsizygus marmoreus]|uniref:Secreted protein n=1 Tax=Hypsizygus marmoreus TaxID=39966 RepID=A0A369JM03_HYPMA|nr:hypothetical protein Hypma_010781 [Hypsizygus marmoreus]